MTATMETLTLRIVNHDKVNKVYYVVQFNQNGTVEKISKDYTHSTSAYAALGRFYQKEVTERYKTSK